MKKVNPLIIIPSRLESTRLPYKPLILINDKPMIVHVALRAQNANLAPVLVATGNKEIVDTLTNYGIKSVLTNQDLPSGTDRISEALSIYDKNNEYDIIINVQGDLPTVDSQCIQDCITILSESNHDISTIGYKMQPNDIDLDNPNVVKAIVSDHKGAITPVQNFKRLVNEDEKHFCYHHIGIYGYRSSSLKSFVSLTPSKNEVLYKLEQLRALDNNMSIGFKESKTLPYAVDTKEDLQKVIEYLNSKK